MSWGKPYIKILETENKVSFRPRGNSMLPKIKSGQFCTVRKVEDLNEIVVGDVLLCKVKGRSQLHLCTAIKMQGGNKKFQISNNHGHVNGYATIIYGKLIRVED